MERAPGIRLSEIISALSFALDLTEGLPFGHAVRSCAIGMRIAEVIGLDEEQRSDLFYALLLKDAGCSSNAAAICELFGSDDRVAKQDRKVVDHRKPFENAGYLLRHTMPGNTSLDRLRRLRGLAAHGAQDAKALMETRCERGAAIARMIELSDATAAAIRALDEHWDGNGEPYGLEGGDIPVLARIMLLAQTTEVFFAVGGVQSAFDVARKRSGRWFDPELVAALMRTEDDAGFWRSLAGEPGSGLIADFEPPDRVLVAEDDRIDRVAEAFATVVDAKSPFTGRHSSRVAEISVGVGRTLGIERTRSRDLRRAALLHDLGKLGVSNLILDKPGKLDDAEWKAMRRHPELTVRILSRVEALKPLALDAGAHHERLDGRGYHLGLSGDQIGWMPRILAVADVYEALTAQRPYRGPLAPGEVLAIMRRDAGTAFCPEAFAALETYVGRAEPGFQATLAAPADPGTAAPGRVSRTTPARTG
jgi:HD-GYP domain-containing protein (c-di-GMP phosphodiesterase class II)